MEVDVRTQVETKILGLLVSLNSWNGKHTMYTCPSNVTKFEGYSYSSYVIPGIYITAHCIFIVYVGNFFSNYTLLRTWSVYV